MVSLSRSREQVSKKLCPHSPGGPAVHAGSAGQAGLGRPRQPGRVRAPALLKHGVRQGGQIVGCTVVRCDPRRRGRRAAGRPYVKAVRMPQFKWNRTVNHFWQLGDSEFHPDNSMANRPHIDFTRTRAPIPYNLAGSVISLFGFGLFLPF